MADQIFNVTAGFFDAVNNDRTYTAAQMTMPYKRIVANGVFATPAGTPSTDLQTVSAGNGMNIKVYAGNGIFANRWFENPAAINITVPNNTTLLPRCDSVIAQVDLRTSGRAGNIVYRTGTPSASPVPPDIGTVANVTEYRLANIYVAAGANTINNDAIVDLRGSSECPWVTSLIQQVDTSTLWNQFQAAYQEQYNEYTEDYTEYVTEQRQAWEDFLHDLTSDLTVSTNVIMLESTYTAAATVTDVPIGIASYNPSTDILQVFINGLFAAEGSKYTVNSAGTEITLTNSISAGNMVYFVVFKSIIGADIESAVSMIQRLENKINTFMADGGWINFYLESGATSYDSTTTPAVRCIGNRVYLRGAIKGITSAGTTFCTLPVSYRPAIDHCYITAAVSGTTAQDYVMIRISATTGTVKLAAISGSISSSAMIPISTTFLAATGNSAAMVYRYVGSVTAYSDLPESGMVAGDVYKVETADAEHSISAGDDVLWNGAEWEKFATSTTMPSSIAMLLTQANEGKVLTVHSSGVSAVSPESLFGEWEGGSF